MDFEQLEELKKDIAHWMDIKTGKNPCLALFFLRQSLQQVPYEGERL